MYKHILMKSFVLYNQFCDNNQKLTHSSLGIPKQFLCFANFESLVMHQCLAFVSNYIGGSISTKGPHLSDFRNLKVVPLLC